MQEALVGELVDREQLDGGDAERAEILDRRLGREPGVGAAQLLAARSGWSFVKPLTCSS